MNQTRIPLLLGAVESFPAREVPELRPVVVDHEEEEGRLLHRGPWIPPPLFEALDRSEGDAEDVGELGLP